MEGRIKKSEKTNTSNRKIQDFVSSERNTISKEKYEVS